MTRDSLLDLIRSTAPQADALAIADEIFQRYAEPHRHYHTLEHIDAMLTPARDLYDDPRLHLAIWYHDVIYDPRSSTNEADSAGLFSEHFYRHLDHEFQGRVRTLILLTEQHDQSDRGGLMEKLMIDLDLGILSTSPSAYDRYTAQIRQEYAHVPDEDFRVGRRRVLRSFLDRDRIYRTDAFADRETTARANLERELATCSKATGM